MKADTLGLLTLVAIAALIAGAGMYFTWHGEPDATTWNPDVPIPMGESFSLCAWHHICRADDPFSKHIDCDGLDAVDKPLCPGADVDAVFRFPPQQFILFNGGFNGAVST